MNVTYKIQRMVFGVKSLPFVQYRTYSKRSNIWSWTRLNNHPNIHIFPDLEKAENHCHQYDSGAIPFVHSSSIDVKSPFHRVTSPSPSEVFEREERRGLA